MRFRINLTVKNSFFFMEFYAVTDRSKIKNITNDFLICNNCNFCRIYRTKNVFNYLEY